MLDDGGSRLLELEASDTNHMQFLDLASRLIAGAALSNGFSHVIVVHIDHWFGERWLGFCGKLLGSAGVRSRRLDGELTPPPFHPHRVLSSRIYRRTDSHCFEYCGDHTSLHGVRPSQSNINRTFQRNRLYAWYSGGTLATDKGVMMVYEVKHSENAAWYTSFNKLPSWHLAQTVGVSPRLVHEFIGRAAPETSTSAASDAPNGG